MTSEVRTEELLLPAGTLVADRYEVVRRLARGGMGELYVARDNKLDRDVVFKAVAPRLMKDDDALARFEREARELSKLSHPHIVTIHDYGRTDEVAYLVMEYLRGETLERALKSSGKFSFKALAPIFSQILEGVAAAHHKARS